MFEITCNLCCKSQFLVAVTVVSTEGKEMKGLNLELERSTSMAILKLVILAERHQYDVLEVGIDVKVSRDALVEDERGES